MDTVRPLCPYILLFVCAWGRLGAQEVALPELEFDSEEAEGAIEYLVEEPAGYLTLPSWSAADLAAIENGGATNLGGGLWPGQRRPNSDTGSGRTGMGPELQIPEDPRVLLPDVVRTSPEIIPEAYLPHYFGSPPKRFLNDVQRLLSAPEWEDIDWYLTYHASESDFDVYVLVFSREEQIPPSISGDELLRTWFPEGNQVLAFYHYGRPERAQIFFPDSLSTRFSRSDFQQNFTEVISSASGKESAAKQLDEFCQKVGTWILWWERRLEGMSDRGKPENPRASGAREPMTAAVPHGGGRDLGSVFWALVVLFLLVVGGLAIWAVKEMVRGRRRSVYLPQNVIQPRLGAPHSGGGSALLSFGSDSTS